MRPFSLYRLPFCHLSSQNSSTSEALQSISASSIRGEGSFLLGFLLFVPWPKTISWAGSQGEYGTHLEEYFLFSFFSQIKRLALFVAHCFKIIASYTLSFSVFIYKACRIWYRKCVTVEVEIKTIFISK